MRRLWFSLAQCALRHRPDRCTAVMFVQHLKMDAKQDVLRTEKDYFFAETLSRLGERRVRAGLMPPGRDQHVCACGQKTFHAAQASRPEPIRPGRQRAAPS